MLGVHWRVHNLIIDNNFGWGPAIVLRNAFDTVSGSEIANGRYNGIDVRGAWETLSNNTVHNFDAITKDAECVAVFKTASHVIIQGNTVHDCSGNGIELYTVDNIGDTQVATDVLIDGNTLWRGGLARGETLIGLKHGSYVTITNNLVSGTADYNWAIGARGNATHVLIANNTLRGNYTGMNLAMFDNGYGPSDVTVVHNVIDNTGGP